MFPMTELMRLVQNPPPRVINPADERREPRAIRTPDDEKQKFPLALLRTSEAPWWSEVAIRQKNDWMDQPAPPFKGDLPPVVMPLRSGRLIAYILAPNLQQEDGYEAAAVCRKALGADAFTIITDGHMPIGKHVDEVARRVTEGTYRRGEMQRACDDDNACERGLYSDCLTITHVSQEETWIFNHSYSYEGKKGKQAVKWTPEHDYGGGQLIVSGMRHIRIGGRVADTLLQILQQEPLTTNFPVDLIAEMLNVHVDPRRINVRTKRELLRQAAFTALRARGFKVVDFSESPMVMK